jgi:transposase
VLSYLRGGRVIEIGKQLDVTRGSVNRWLQSYDREGADGLKPRKAAGPTPRLSEDQREELVELIEAGPQGAGYLSGVWTGPMIGDMIRRHFGVKYHNHYIPELLHKLGFSVQRPRKRLARADHERQEYWLRTTFPEIKKSGGLWWRSPLRGRGELLARRHTP